MPPRNPTRRQRYMTRALDQIPRLLGAIDRNPYRKTHGCFDRQFWHYRTAAFPSQMYQEGVLPLALVYATGFPGNRWHGNARVKELAVAGMHFAAASSHADGSCDDYYPFERALGAAVFSLAASTKAYTLLGLRDLELIRWFERRTQWLLANDESGRLANHHALAALGLLRTARVTGNALYRRAAASRIDKVLDWQNDEGWFEEYGGADPGYQTVTIDCLAKYRRATGDTRLDEPLGRALDFATLFQHPDNSYGGPYGSRGTSHFYPHGMELLAGEHPKAARLADRFLAGLEAGTVARFEDDRMFAHRLGNLIEAYIDGDSPRREPADEPTNEPDAWTRYLPQAGMLVRRAGREYTIVSIARGGVFLHFPSDGEPVSDAGLLVETSDGRVVVSHYHDATREARFDEGYDLAQLDHASSRLGTSELAFSVGGPLHDVRFETATPIKQAMLHVGMCMAGRWCRTAVRRLLQRRLITGRRESPVHATRQFEFLPSEPEGKRFCVTDTIELTRPGLRVARMAFGTDHESAYVAAGNVYQPSVFGEWIDLADHLDALNTHQQVTVTRRF